MSKSKKLLSALTGGEQLTTKQIRSRFGIANPNAAVDGLRKQGYAIYSNARANKTGKAKNFFRLGTPSRAVVAAGYRSMSTRGPVAAVA